MRVDWRGRCRKTTSKMEQQSEWVLERESWQTKNWICWKGVPEEGRLETFVLWPQPWREFPWYTYTAPRFQLLCRHSISIILSHHFVNCLPLTLSLHPFVVLFHTYTANFFSAAWIMSSTFVCSIFYIICLCILIVHSHPQMAGQIDMNRQSDLMAAFEEQCGK